MCTVRFDKSYSRHNEMMAEISWDFPDPHCPPTVSSSCVCYARSSRRGRIFPILSTAAIPGSWEELKEGCSNLLAVPRPGKGHLGEGRLKTVCMLSCLVSPAQVPHLHHCSNRLVMCRTSLIPEYGLEVYYSLLAASADGQCHFLQTFRCSPLQGLEGQRAARG